MKVADEFKCDSVQTYGFSPALVFQAVVLEKPAGTTSSYDVRVGLLSRAQRQIAKGVQTHEACES